MNIFSSEGRLYKFTLQLGVNENAVSPFSLIINPPQPYQPNSLQISSQCVSAYLSLIL